MNRRVFLLSATATAFGAALPAVAAEIAAKPDMLSWLDGMFAGPLVADVLMHGPSGKSRFTAPVRVTVNGNRVQVEFEADRTSNISEIVVRRMKDNAPLFAWADRETSMVIGDTLTLDIGIS